jgi:glycosyltransferase 2 family protein
LRSTRWAAGLARWKAWLKAFGVAICLFSLLYFLKAIGENFRTLTLPRWDSSVWASVSAAVALHMGAVAASGVAWHRILLVVGEPSELRLSLSIFAVSQLAKYIPGNVAQHVGRVTLARAHGISTRGVLMTMVLESAGVLLGGSAIALLALLAKGPASFGGPRVMPSSWRIAIVALAATAIMAIGPMVFLGRRRGDMLPVRNGSHRRLAWALAACSLAYVGVFLIHGLSFDLVARGVFGAPESHFLPITGIFAVAWISGFVTPGAPAGIGVREAVLIVALRPIYGETTAVGLSMALRAVSTVGDGLAFVGGLLLRRGLRRAPTRS